MKRKLITIIVVLTSIFESFGQGFENKYSSSTKMLAQIDTFYFPFYNGVQMIEVDHLAYWDKKTLFLGRFDLRSTPLYMYNPAPLGNEYYFRDTTGEIVKAYNTSYFLKELTKHFSNIPINKKNTILGMTSYHSFKNKAAQVVWTYNPQLSFLFYDYYKISNKHALDDQKDILYGLIDTLGNVKIPIQYEEILPLNKNLIVKQHGKWGIMDKNQKMIVPIQYDEFNNYYSEPKNNKIIYFVNKDKYVAIYKVKEKLLFKIDNYDHVSDGYFALGYLLVQKNNLFGLIDLNGEIILPVIYDYININKNHSVSVEKNRKTYNLKLKK